MEYLTFNKSGQWELHKADEPKSDYTPGSKQYKARTSTAMEGALREDSGTRGALHNFGGNSKARSPSIKNNVKPFQEVESYFNAVNPEVGN